MILKEFRELRRDRRTLGMMIAMPLLLLVVFGYAANFYVSNVKTAIVGPQATQAAAMLPDFFDVTMTDPAATQADAEQMLRDNEVERRHRHRASCRPSRSWTARISSPPR